MRSISLAILYGLLCKFHTVSAVSTKPRCLMYLTGQHDVIPSLDRLSHITHVALAFMGSSMFNDEDRTEWPIFRSVEDTRRVFLPETKILVAIGGWGNNDGFEEAAYSAASREKFAKNVARMLDATGADGVDVDWEYPGGNGDDYKQIPNESRAWEIEAYPKLVAAIRTAVGPDKLITAAWPGLERDMLALTDTTVPGLMDSINFVNIMTYDMMNRRDNVTKHHSGIQLSKVAIENYVSRGAPPSKINLGIGFYVKWFRTQHDACEFNQVGCPTMLLEDPETGADLGRTGGFSYHDTVQEEDEASFLRAKQYGRYDEVGGGYYYWDNETDQFWSFDTPAAIIKKIPQVIWANQLGGVFAWGLGEDAPKFEHLDAVNMGLKALNALSRLGDPRSEL